VGVCVGSGDGSFLLLLLSFGFSVLGVLFSGLSDKLFLGFVGLEFVGTVDFVVSEEDEAVTDDVPFSPVVFVSVAFVVGVEVIVVSVSVAVVDCELVLFLLFSQPHEVSISVHNISIAAISIICFID